MVGEGCRGGGCWVAMAECNGSCVFTKTVQWCARNFFLALLARFYCHPGDFNLYNITYKTNFTNEA